MDDRRFTAVTDRDLPAKVDDPDELSRVARILSWVFPIGFLFVSGAARAVYSSHGAGCWLSSWRSGRSCFCTGGGHRRWASVAVSPRTKSARYVSMGEMTQQELADRVGVARQTVNAIEGNKYSPSLEVAFRIARGVRRPAGTGFPVRERGVSQAGDRRLLVPNGCQAQGPSTLNSTRLRRASAEFAIVRLHRS